MKSNCHLKYVAEFASVKTFSVLGITLSFKKVTLFDVNKHNYSDIL